MCFCTIRVKVNILIAFEMGFFILESANEHETT